MFHPLHPAIEPVVFIWAALRLQALSLYPYRWGAESPIGPRLDTPVGPFADGNRGLPYARLRTTVEGGLRGPVVPGPIAA